MNNNMFAHIYQARQASFGTSCSDELMQLHTDLIGAIVDGNKIQRPRCLMFKVTQQCNSGCIYCDYAHNKKYISSGSVDMISTSRYMQVLAEAQSMGVDCIALNGGEPLMRTDIVTLVNETCNRKILPIVMTNGLLLEKKWDELGAAGLKYVLISLDTLDADTFQQHRGVGFSQTIRGVESAIKMREKYGDVVIHLTSVLTRHNIDHIIPLLQYCNDNKIWLEISVYDTYCQKDDVHAIDDEAKLSDLCQQLIAMRRDGAYLSSSEIYIEHLTDFCIGKKRTPDGYICYSGYGILLLDDQLVARPCWGEDIIGDMHCNTLSQLWNNDKMESCRKMMLEGRCSGCWNLCTEFNALCTALIEQEV